MELEKSQETIWEPNLWPILREIRWNIMRVAHRWCCSHTIPVTPLLPLLVSVLSQRCGGCCGCSAPCWLSSAARMCGSTSEWRRWSPGPGSSLPSWGCDVFMFYIYYFFFIDSVKNLCFVEPCQKDNIYHFWTDNKRLFSSLLVAPILWHCWKCELPF